MRRPGGPETAFLWCQISADDDVVFRWCIIVADRVKSSPQRFRIDGGSVRISVMTNLTGHDRTQTLLPESLDEYVGAENPVRFIERYRPDIRGILRYE
jgi:hypothetical protein